MTITSPLIPFVLIGFFLEINILSYLIAKALTYDMYRR